MATINVTGLSFFLPVFSFLFVFIVVYAVLAKTKILGEGQWINILIGLIVAVIFIGFSTPSFSSEEYIRTIVPWFAVLFVCVFLVLLLMGLATKDVGKIMTSRFAWGFSIVLIVIFLIAAIRVFKPVLDPVYGVSSSPEGPQIISQLREVFTGPVGGGLLLIIIAIIVAWVVAKAK